MNKVLIKLLADRAVRSNEHSWQWVTRSPGNPSLANSVTAKLFRADLVEEVDGEMKLTAAGRVCAEQLQG